MNALPTRHSDIRSRVIATPAICQHRQWSLPGLDVALAETFKPDSNPPGDTGRGAPSRYTLFLALFPQPESAQHIAQVTANLLARHRWTTGRPFPPDRLHITLHAVAAFAETIPHATVAAAIAAARTLDHPPAHIVFDHVLSFPASEAFVLRCNAESDAAIARLRQSLAAALRRNGLRPAPSSTPHMTVLYDRHLVARQSIEPICWTAIRFALILSHVGSSYHQWLGQWHLTTQGPRDSGVGD